jgi:hypothetical protein
MMAQLPTEIWIAIFESIHNDVDEPLIFDECNEKPINKFYEHRREMTRELQQLQLVSRAWRVHYTRLLIDFEASGLTRRRT